MSDIVERLREYADIAEAAGKPHWATAMRDASREIKRLGREVETLQHQVAAASITADQYDALDRQTQELAAALQSLVYHLYPGLTLRMMDTWDGPWPKVAAALRR